MRESNESVFDRIRRFVKTFNRGAHACKPLFAVNIIVQDDKLHICRSRNYVKNNKRSKCSLQNSGGCIERGETAENAAARELYEEMWDDIPNDIKSQYDFPVFAYTQKIYFGNSTVIFIHKVPKRYRLYEGEIPPLKHKGEGVGGGGGNNVITDDIVMNDANDVDANDVDANDVGVNVVNVNDVDATITTTTISPITSTPPDDGAGEIDKLELIPISSIYDSLNTGWNGDKWRRCTIWSFKKLRPIIELYARIDI